MDGAFKLLAVKKYLVMSIFFSLIFFSLIEEIIYTRYGYRDISRVVMNLFFDFCAAQQQNDMI